MQEGDRVLARLVVSVACCAALIGGSAAFAAPGRGGPPAPTVQVTTYLATGTALPVSTIAAGWTHVSPGCRGQMQASGPAVTGTTTLVRGDMVSRPFRPRRGQLLSVSVEQGGRRLLQPLTENFGLAVRLRAMGHRWSPWYNLGVTSDPSIPPPSLLLSFSVGASIGLVERPRPNMPMQQVETRLSDRVTATGDVNDSFGVQVGC